MAVMSEEAGKVEVADNPTNFEEFFLLYLTEHSLPKTRLVHYISTAGM